MIRAFRRSDADAVAAFLHEQPFPGPMTAAGLLHWRAQHEAPRAAMWVAEEDGETVGWGRARLLATAETPAAGEVWAFVHPSRRRRGYGGRLVDAALQKLGDGGAGVIRSWSDEEAGRAFLVRRGFEPVGAQRISALDPRTVSAVDSPPPAGVEIAPLSDLEGHDRELHGLYAAALLDVPDAHAEGDAGFEAWRDVELEHPELSRDGSFVALVGGLPASFAFLSVDEPARLAANRMTGTRADLRGRGLARLVKLAGIRWAAANGYERIVTTNDETNIAALRLNESLGYEPVGTETEWATRL